MANSFPYMPWYPSDYIGSTAHLSLEEDAIYRRLLDLMWMQGGSVPNDPAWLKRRLRVTDEQWTEYWPGVADLVSDDGEALTQRRVQREIDKATDRSESARKAAEKRWQNERKADAKPTHSDGNAGAMRSHSGRNAIQNQSHIQNHSASEDAEGAPGALPDEMDKEPFSSTWSEWISYRRKHRWTTKRPWAEQQLSKLAQYGPAIAAQALRQSMENGWKGVFPEKVEKRHKTADREGAMVSEADKEFKPW